MPPILGAPTVLLRLFCFLKEAGNIMGKSHPGPIPAGPFPDVTSSEPGQPWWFLPEKGIGSTAFLEDFCEAHYRSGRVWPPDHDLCSSYSFLPDSALDL